MLGTIESAYRQWLNGMGFAERPGQLRMMRAIVAALRRTGGAPPLIAVEAPPGTGKTIAYLHAMMPLARALGKQLVVSTSTVTLQEQLMQKDLPSLREHSGLDFDWALVKGRRRYLCHARFARIEALEEQTPQGGLDLGQTLPSAGARALYREMRGALDSGAWDGDRDHWPQTAAVSARDWLAVTSSSAECLGHRCGHFSHCCLYVARQQASQVLCRIANHDLVLADLTLGGGVLLPPPEQTLYVFDEAHRLGEKLCAFMASHVGMEASDKWIDTCGAYLHRCSEQALPGHPLEPSATRELALVDTRLSGLRQTLRKLRSHCVAQLDDGQHTAVMEAVPPELSALASHAADDYQHLAALLGTVRDACGAAVARAEDAPAAIEQRYRDLGGLMERAEEARNLWRRYAEPDEIGQPPWARWLQLDASSALRVSAAPVQGGQLLREQLWSRCAGAVLSSATLTALGRFDLLCNQTGLPIDSAFEVLPQAFDHERAASLHIPRHGFDPRNPARHSREVAGLLSDLIPRQRAGSLVLFASRRQLDNVLELLPESLRETILVQGEGLGRGQLLQQHCQTVDEGRPSTLFGLASLAEGVDLPGDYCRLLVLTKLPFAPPDDPIGQTLSRWIAHGGGHPFDELTLPEAARRLVQACGRLLRADSDRGRIVCLDARLHTSSYGARLLDALPPYRRATMAELQ